MCQKQRLSIVLAIVLLMASPGSLPSQIDSGNSLLRVIEIRDPQGARLGTVMVAGRSGKGYAADTEYWRFSADALREISGLDSLEFTVWKEGDWDDPQISEALSWQPAGDAVEWSHPATVEWTPREKSSPPPAPSGTYFGKADLGGLTIRYSPGGDSSLTWFKLTEGAHMPLGDGVVFERTEEEPDGGSWWRGSVEIRGL